MLKHKTNEKELKTKKITILPPDYSLKTSNNNFRNNEYVNIHSSQSHHLNDNHPTNEISATSKTSINQQNSSYSNMIVKDNVK